VNRNIGGPPGSSSSNTNSGLDGTLPLWSLHVDDSGSVCFSFFSSQDPSGKLESKCILGHQMVINTLKTNPGIVNMKPLEKVEGNIQQQESAWIHIAVVVDDSFVSIFVDGNCEVKGTLTPPVVEESCLIITTLYVGLNLVSGWRLAEFRIWADARSPNDISQNKDNYLALAAKRKRLLLNFTKGPKEKELFLKPHIQPKLDSQPATKISSLDTILNSISSSNAKVETVKTVLLPNISNTQDGMPSLGLEKPKIQPIKFDAPVGSVSSAATRRLQAKQASFMETKSEDVRPNLLPASSSSSSTTPNETYSAPPIIEEKEFTEEDGKSPPSLPPSTSPLSFPASESVDTNQPKVSTAAAKRLQAKMQKSSTPGPIS